MLPQIVLDRNGDAPLHQQIGDELRRLILSGGLVPGARLPSTRRAAAELGVSRNLVVLAYEQLQLEGYLKSAVGVGTWVPESLGPNLLTPRGAGQLVAAEPARPAASVLSSRGERLSRGRSSISASRPTYPLRPSAVAADLFPSRTWSRLTARSWRRRTPDLVAYGEVQGLGALREVLAEHLGRYRAVHASPDQVLMTAGSQQSLDMIARLLLDRDDVAAVEQPGYDGAISALRGAGVRLAPVPVDEHGLDPEAVERLGARCIYTTPSHQYPLGVTLTIERRLALLRWADRTGSWIIEDDYDSEFRYESRPLPSLQGLSNGQHVVYVGTFSKVLAPALRLGYIVLPEGLVADFVRARQVVDHSPPLSIQVPMAEFIGEGHLERHIARMRGIYGERRRVLRRAVLDEFGERCPLVPGDGGLHVTMLLPEGIDDVAVARLAFSRGIDPQPLSAHYIAGEPRRGLVLGFGGSPANSLRAAVGTLRECIDEVARGSVTA